VTPDQYCQERAAQSGSSFYYSFLFLEPPRRQAITALYAFCREVDDVVDECPDALLARTKLAWWRGEVKALFEGCPSHPVTQALAASLKNFSLPQEQLLEIIDGMEMDLDHVRYADFKALHLYCYRVASVVGLLAAEIFGYRERLTLKYAHDLGWRSSSPTSSAMSAKMPDAAASICRRTNCRALASLKPTCCRPATATTSAG